MFFITTEFFEYKEQLFQITPTPYHCHLQKIGRPGLSENSLTVAAAIIDGITAGVVIALQDRGDPGMLAVVHLYVRKKYRRIGIGGALLQCIEKKARDTGKKKAGITALLKRESDQKEAIRQLLLKRQWKDIDYKKSEYYITDTNIVKEAWFNEKLPEGFTLLPWRDISIEEREYLERNRRGFEGADRKLKKYYMDPLDVENYDYLTSYCIKDERNGHIVGWNITMMRSDKVLIFRKIYVMPELRSKGLFYPLFAKSISLSIDLSDEDGPKVCFLVQGENKSMRIGIDFLMGHLCSTIADTYVSSKEL